MYEPETLAYLLILCGVVILLLEVYLTLRFWIWLDYYRLSMYLGKILIPLGIVISSAYFYEAYLLLNDLPLFYIYSFVEFSVNLTFIIFITTFIFGLKYGLKNWILRRKYMFNKDIGPYTIKGFNKDEDGGYSLKNKLNPNKFEFLVISDFHAGSQNVEIIINSMQNLIKKSENIKFIICGGDLVSDGRKNAHWKAFFGQVSPILELPFFAIPGNHDGQFLSMAKKWKYYFPYNYPEAENGFYYKILYDNCAFFLLDIYNGGRIDKLPSTQQIKWLEAQLGNLPVNIQFRFLILHKSIFSTDKEGRDHHLEAILLPISKKYNIRLVFSGHSHHFEHFSFDEPKYDYFVSGGGGGQNKINFKPSDHSKDNEGRKTLLNNLKQKEITHHFIHVKVEKDNMKIYAIDKYGKKIYSTVIK